jgi:hypothetical protein
MSTKIKRKIAALLAPLFALAFATIVRGTTVIPPNFDRLVSHAQVIFDGEVTGVQSQWMGEGSNHRIVSFVSFKVDDTLKGDAGKTYTLRMLGGTVDGQTMQVTDAPVFKIGERDLLFVENNGSQFIPLVGIQHGRVRIQKDENGNDLLLTGEDQPLTDVNQFGSDEASIAKGRRSLSLDDFKSAVKARMQEQKIRTNTP